MKWPTRAGTSCGNEVVMCVCVVQQRRVLKMCIMRLLVSGGSLKFDQVRGAVRTLQTHRPTDIRNAHTSDRILERVMKRCVELGVSGVYSCSAPPTPTPPPLASQIPKISSVFPQNVRCVCVRMWMLMENTPNGVPNRENARLSTRLCAAA